MKKILIGTIILITVLITCTNFAYATFDVDMTKIDEFVDSAFENMEMNKQNAKKYSFDLKNGIIGAAGIFHIIIVPAIITLVVTLTKIAAHRNIKMKPTAREYLNKNSVEITRSEDIYEGTSRDKRKIDK